MSKIIQQQDNRRVFIDTLNELNDPKIILLIPDVGWNYIEQAKFRVINTGVTEEATMIIAAAMALDGWKPYVYSMRNFVLFRPAEMVRNGIVCHKANVKLLGVKGSDAYRFLGFSHNLLHDKEDLNFCKNIGLKYYVPKTAKQVRDIIIKTYNSKEPCYIPL